MKGGEFLVEHQKISEIVSIYAKVLLYGLDTMKNIDLNDSISSER